MLIRREIEVTRKGLPRPIDVTFGTNMLSLEFVITDFELPDEATVEAYAIGVSKKLVKQSCEVSGNVISFTPEIGLFEEGKNMLQLAANHDGKDLFSFYIPVICQKTMFYESAQNLEEDPTFLGMVMQMKQDVGELAKQKVNYADIEDELSETSEKPVKNKTIFAKFKEIATKITDIVKKIGYLLVGGKVTPQMYGAVGDGVADDTEAMQNAFNAVATNGGYLFIPKGRYKVTSPITVDWSSTSTTKRNFLQKIIGAGSQAFEKQYDNSVIVGYNIPANRGVIELIGNGNTWGTETRIKDLGIECDEATCDSMSFALKYGDARNFKLSRVKLRGHNGILARCGSIVDSNGNSTTNGYEQINIKFEQCDIYTFPNSTKGFAFLPEGIITGHYAVMDNIVVDSCCINGVWVINSVNALFQSCHVAINNVANKEITTNNVGLLNGYEIDYATGFYVAQAMNCVFQNCYFEDYRRGIQITPTIGNIRNVSIMNCYLNPGCNQFNADGSRLCADYGIRINSGMSDKVVRNVLVQNNVFRLVEGDTEFVVANVSNEFAKRFVFRDNCTTSTQVVPKVINTTDDGYDICNDVNEGSSIKNVVTSQDSKEITIELTNGRSYTIKGSTPVKGVDYFTEAEIEEITENASALAKAGLQQIAPPTWVEKVADMTDTSKNYVLLESGNIWAYMKKTKTVAGETVPNFTNVIDGTNGYIKEGYRYSLSGGAFKEYTTVSNFASIIIPIPTSGSHTVRIRGMEYNASYPAIYGGTTNNAFTSAMGNQGSTNTKDDNGDWIFTVNNTYDVSYIITSGVLTTDADKVICTVNEEIAYEEIPSTTETVEEWTDTGHYIVQS